LPNLDKINSFQASLGIPPGTCLEVEGYSEGEIAAKIDHYLEYTSQFFQFLENNSLEIGGSFKADFNVLSNEFFILKIKSYVRKKFGIVSMRIFNLLIDKKMIEEKEISKICLITPKECREKLYSKNS
jgi:hypothetical protein